MKVLSFDIATNTGVAFGRPGEVPLTKVIDLGTGKSDAARFAKALRMVEGFIEARQPDLISVECPIGPGSSTLLVGLYACVVGQCMAMGHNPKRYQVQSIRKHFLGKALTSRDYPGLSKAESRKEIKRVVIARCNALGWRVDTDDEADAAALWDFTIAKERAGGAMPKGLFG